MPKSTHARATELGRLLLQRGYFVTCAESCTGGGVAQALTAVAGSSAWFEGSFVTYSNRLKTALLGVPEETLANCGAVSEAVVVAMAEGALARTEADVAVAVSGIAGPGGGSLDKPVGTVWFAWISKCPRGENKLQTRCEQFAGDREAVRQQAVVEALAGLVRAVDYTG